MVDIEGQSQTPLGMGQILCHLQISPLSLPHKIRIVQILYHPHFHPE